MIIVFNIFVYIGKLFLISGGFLGKFYEFIRIRCCILEGCLRVYELVKKLLKLCFKRINFFSLSWCRYCLIEFINFFLVFFGLEFNFGRELRLNFNIFIV